MSFNPDYVPSGKNNVENAYNEKRNHVKLAREDESKEEFETEAEDPLAPFYASGAIAIHHSADGAIPAGGPATAFVNQGGAGDVFDATVVGTPLPLSGNYIQAQPNDSYPQMANSADLMGVHLMWVMAPALPNGTYMCFGSAVAPAPYIRLSNGLAIQVYDGGGSIALSGVPQSSEPRLFEVRLDDTTATLYVDGAIIDVENHTFSQVLVDNIMRRNSTSQAFAGLFGDILGVIIAHPQSDAALAAARAEMRAKFGLVDGGAV